MEHVMLDLETLGTAGDAAIVSIGAVVFGADGIAPNPFYCPVRLQSAIDAGLRVDGSTVEWWTRQPDAARAVFGEHAAELDSALLAFAQWLPGRAKVWGNGASFDNAILASAYRAVGRPLPWKFWNDRCYRTIAAGIGVRRQQLGTHHNALDDARSQAEHLIRYAPEAIV